MVVFFRYFRLGDPGKTGNKTFTFLFIYKSTTFLRQIIITYSTNEVYTKIIRFLTNRQAQINRE